MWSVSVCNVAWNIYLFDVVFRKIQNDVSTIFNIFFWHLEKNKQELFFIFRLWITKSKMLFQSDNTIFFFFFFMEVFGPTFVHFDLTNLRGICNTLLTMCTTIGRKILLRKVAQRGLPLPPQFQKKISTLLFIFGRAIYPYIVRILWGVGRMYKLVS